MIFSPSHFITLMGRVFLILQNLRDLPDSVALIKTSLKSSVYCLERVTKMHLKPTLLCTVLVLKDFDQLFAIKFTAVNLILFSFFVYAGGFLEEIATFLKTSSVNCGLQQFLKCMSCFAMRTLSLNLKTGFLYSLSGLLYRTDKKSQFLIVSGIKFNKPFFWNSGL